MHRSHLHHHHFSFQRKLLGFFNLRYVIVLAFFLCLMFFFLNPFSSDDLNLNSTPPPEIHSVPSHIHGSILGQDFHTFHRLTRSSDLIVENFKETEKRYSVVIVGGGIAGLSAGWKLWKSGISDWLILEAENELGGNAASYEDTDAKTKFPRAGHYIIPPSTRSHEWVELLQDIGVVVGFNSRGDPIYNETHWCRQPDERLFIDGEWSDDFPPMDGLLEESEFRLFKDFVSEMANLTDSEGRKAFALPIDRSSPSFSTLRALDSRSFWDFLVNVRGVKSQKLLWLADYYMRDEYGSNMKQTSAWVGIHYWASRDRGDEYLTWPEGNGYISNRIRDIISSGDFLKGAIVFKIKKRDSEGYLKVLFEDRATGETRMVKARSVVYSAPRNTAPYVIEGYSHEEWLDQVVYSPWMTAFLRVKNNPRWPNEMAWDNVMYKNSNSVGYVVSTHQKMGAAYKGRSVWTYYRPFGEMSPRVARQKMIEASWEDWVIEILNDLRESHPDILEIVENVDVWLMGHAMIRPYPGFVWGKARESMKLQTLREEGILFAHSDMSGISVIEEAHYWGAMAGAEVMALLGIVENPIDRAN